MKRTGSRVNGKNRIFVLDEKMAVIEIVRRNGSVIFYLIDREDVSEMSSFRWFYQNGYCYTTDPGGHQFPLVWLLLRRPEAGHVIRHMNRDLRDCRKSNLREVPEGFNNLFNKNTRANHSTEIRGVYECPGGSYLALVGPGGKRKRFETLEDAVEARKGYEDSVKRRFGGEPHG